MRYVDNIGDRSPHTWAGLSQLARFSLMSGTSYNFVLIMMIANDVVAGHLILLNYCTGWGESRATKLSGGSSAD